MSKTLLERQQILAERINKSIYSAISKDRQDNLPESNTNEGDILWHHRHTCVFKMLSNNKNL